MIKILILIDSSTEFSRRFLAGLIRYSNEHGPWDFYRLPAYYKQLYGEEGILERVKEWQIDAVIAQWEYDEVDFLKKTDIPVFLQSFRDATGRFSKISGDYVRVGAMAARFFAKRRFTNFAYYGNTNFFWSKARAEGFRLEVEKLDGNFFYFESELLNPVQWSRSHIELDNWLLSLPKPIALFACDDNFALQVSEMCKVNNINIPNEISLMGVDNDELVCTLSHPSISSIETDDENGGYKTGMMIHRSITSKKNIPFNIVIDPIRIVLRHSTEKYDISDAHILRIVRYIEEHIESILSIDDLVKLVPLSRRSLELKFKTIMGISIYQYLLDSKLEYVIYLLLNTDKSLLDIAINAGFNDVRSVYRLFKKKTGYTPIDYRKNFSNI